MNGPADRARRTVGRESAAVAMAVWTALHAIVVVMVAADYRVCANLSARDIGLPLAAATGVVGGSLFMAGLLRTNGLALVAGGVAFVTIQLVAMFCGLAGDARAWACAGQVLTWLGCLRLLNASARARWPIGLPTVCALYTVGTALLWYCFAEFGANGHATNVLGYSGPLLTIGTWGFWVHAAGVCAVAGLLWGWDRGKNAQNSNAPQMPI